MAAPNSGCATTREGADGRGGPWHTATVRFCSGLPGGRRGRFRSFLSAVMPDLAERAMPTVAVPEYPEKRIADLRRIIR